MDTNQIIGSCCPDILTLHSGDTIIRLYDIANNFDDYFAP